MAKSSVYDESRATHPLQGADQATGEKVHGREVGGRGWPHRRKREVDELVGLGGRPVGVEEHKHFGVRLFGGKEI